MTPQLPATNTSLKITRVLFSILAGLLITLTLFALVRAGILYSLYTWLLAKVVENTGLDLWQSRLLTLGLLVLLWLFPWHLLVLPWIKGARTQVALWTLVTMLALTGMEFITRDVYFSRVDGQPQKYYVQTLDGFKFATTPGNDPVYGIPYKPITREVAKQYLLWKKRGGRKTQPFPKASTSTRQPASRSRGTQKPPTAQSSPHTKFEYPGLEFCHPCPEFCRSRSRILPSRVAQSQITALRHVVAHNPGPFPQRSFYRHIVRAICA